MRDVAERVEATHCPSCGRQTLRFWQDPGGHGGACSSMDCLEVFSTDELIEPEERD